MLRTSTIVLLASLVGSAAAQEALGSGFTYQGRLKQAGAPFSGQVDLTFTLFDAAADGAALGSQA
ncbi:MAG: hypothetical protein IT190_06295, partial [Microbacteriaceae bacterium]|nr:hypothetical protein [Microbacteriaceae bacterium]